MHNQVIFMGFDKRYTVRAVAELPKEVVITDQTNLSVPSYGVDAQPVVTPDAGTYQLGVSDLLQI